MPTVRITKQIMTTLLAAQIFIVFGLCQVICCLSASNSPAQTLAADSHSEHIQTIQAAETESHCHAKTEKKVSAKPPAKLKAAQHCHGENPADDSLGAATARICQCDAISQQNPVFSLNQSDSTQQKQTLAAAPVWSVAIQSQPPAPTASPPTDNSHPPPFNGHQLHLRI